MAHRTGPSMWTADSLGVSQSNDILRDIGASASLRNFEN